MKELLFFIHLVQQNVCKQCICVSLWIPIELFWKDVSAPEFLNRNSELVLGVGNHYETRMNYAGRKYNVETNIRDYEVVYVVSILLLL